MNRFFVFCFLCFFVGHITGIAQPKSVDMGLSVRWAPYNIGATSPYDYGDFYAWGETAVKTDYSAKTSKLKEYYTPKYYSRTGDLKTRMEYSDDAARQNWGGRWRIPTIEEWEELEKNCSWKWIWGKNGLNGYEVTSKINGNSIFLPAAGFKWGISASNVRSIGRYWSSSKSKDDSLGYWGFMFDYKDVDGKTYSDHWAGLSVRPVLDNY